MRLLTDDELVAQVTSSRPTIEGVYPQADWYSKDSPVQPSSIDLHIGSIYLPGVDSNAPGGVLRPKTKHILKPGRTAVVLTREEFRLPGHIAGIGFPPSHISFQGILMTNRGHVDPGYAGPMRFTVINMGSQDYPLKRDDEIVTMLLIELSSSARQHWLRRHDGEHAGSPAQDDIDRLSADFLDVDRRATEISERISSEAVRTAELEVKNLSSKLTLYGVIGAALLAGLFSLWTTLAKPAWQDPLNEVKREIAVLKTSLELAGLKSRLDEMERLIQTSRQVPQPAIGSQGTQP